eukprot:scaffold3618_cov129-Cylindrotheca_fusiformis.AAC.26
MELNMNLLNLLLSQDIGRSILTSCRRIARHFRLRPVFAGLVGSLSLLSWLTCIRYPKKHSSEVVFQTNNSP